jgi:hypothetical protein
LVDKRRNWSWITALGSSAPVAGDILFEIVADEGGGQGADLTRVQRFGDAGPPHAEHQ